MSSKCSSHDAIAFDTGQRNSKMVAFVDPLVWTGIWAPLSIFCRDRDRFTHSGFKSDHVFCLLLPYHSQGAEKVICDLDCSFKILQLTQIARFAKLELL